jgi:hypothetical protein
VLQNPVELLLLKLAALSTKSVGTLCWRAGPRRPCLQARLLLLAGLALRVTLDKVVLCCLQLAVLSMLMVALLRSRVVPVSSRRVAALRWLRLARTFKVAL